ncbi:MAG TPA: branched-chain amino acid ABC transporter ATP-binding protein/permease [Streptosporangiaceae bacterium]|nr:branched-chain amino acid ABC transporter ATP-binding protein/permease [Streptosporangiaceae bacterium]
MLLVYFGTDLLATWGLNLQYGVAGVLNFAFIANLAVGAYAYAVLTLGPSSGNGGFQTYVIGLHLAPALAIVVATAAGCAFGALVGTIGLKRLRPDYQAIALLVVSIVALTVVQADSGLLNGNPGLTLFPNPLGGTGPTGNGWLYVVLVLAVCLVGFVVLRKFTDGPMGRSLRTVRDDDRAALSIGKNVVALRILVQCVGGGFAALSGALLAGFLGAWGPSAWQYVETMSLLTAVIVGGVASNLGVVVGTLLVPVVLQQAAQYLPQIPSRPGLAEDIGWMLTAILTIAFIWLRPRGIVPERRPRYGAGARRLPFSMAPLTSVPAGSAPAPLAGGAIRAAPRAPAQRRANAVAAQMNAAPLLSVRDIVVSFGGVRAVDGTSIDAPAAAITGLIGPNGAGKSTLINVVSGFIRAQQGQITFDGQDITRRAPNRRARHGLVRTFQLPRLFGRLTTIENLLVAARDHPAESVAGVILGRRHWAGAEQANLVRARELLARFEMTSHTDELAANLSGGQRRMLEVMRCLMTGPSMLLLDEPFAGLSPRWCGLLEQAMTGLREEGLAFVLIEHELGIIDRLCDSVVVMAQGRVLSTGTMAELRTRREVQAAYVIG